MDCIKKELKMKQMENQIANESNEYALKLKIEKNVTFNDDIKVISIHDINLHQIRDTHLESKLR